MHRGERLRWSTHIAIAREISITMELSKEEGRLLIEGSVDPDRHPDLLPLRHRLVRVPHHTLAPDMIMENVWRARWELLTGRRGLAMIHLGRALHYLQDRSVGFSSQEDHDWREARLEKVDPDLEAIARGIKAARSSPRVVWKAMRRVAPRRNPSRAMREACFASATMAAAVLMSPSEKGFRGWGGASVAILIGVLFAAGGVYSLSAYGIEPVLLSLVLSPALILAGLARIRNRKEDRMWHTPPSFWHPPYH